MSIVELVRASRAAQGLPPHVEDEATLRRIAVLLTENEKTAKRAGRKGGGGE